MACLAVLVHTFAESLVGCACIAGHTRLRRWIVDDGEIVGTGTRSHGDMGMTTLRHGVRTSIAACVGSVSVAIVRGDGIVVPRRCANGVYAKGGC